MTKRITEKTLATYDFSPYSQFVAEIRRLRGLIAKALGENIDGVGSIPQRTNAPFLLKPRQSARNPTHDRTAGSVALSPLRRMRRYPDHRRGLVARSVSDPTARELP